MHSTFSQPHTQQPQTGILGKFQSFWYKNRTPKWQPENFTVSNEVLQNKDTLVNQAEQVFYQYDRDRSGFLDRKEFKNALLALGLEKKQTKYLTRMVESDQNGNISIDEFINGFLYVKSGGELREIPGKKGLLQQQRIGTGITGQQQGYQQQGYQTGGVGLGSGITGTTTGITSGGVGQQQGYQQQGFSPQQQQPLQQPFQQGLGGLQSSTTGFGSGVVPPPPQGFQQGIGSGISGQQPSYQQGYQTGGLGTGLTSGVGSGLSGVGGVGQQQGYQQGIGSGISGQQGYQQSGVGIGGVGTQQQGTKQQEGLQSGQQQIPGQFSQQQRPGSY